MMGCTMRPVSGAATHRMGMSSALAPRLEKMRLVLAFCSAKPNWMPINPKLMFQICQKLRRGFWRVLVVAGAAAMDAIEGSGNVGKKESCPPR